MGTKSEALLEALPEGYTVDYLLKVQAAYIEEDGDITTGEQYHLCILAEEPAEASAKLQAARVAYFDGSPPEREYEEGEPFI